MRVRRKVIWSLAVAWWLATPHVVQAYIGPGAGISVIGTAVAFLGAVIFAIIGFVWYPLKRLRAAVRKRRGNDDHQASLS